MKIKEVRRVVGALLKVPVDRRDPHAKMVSAQDTLEFAATLLGIKPVFLLGRGFDDPAWVSAVKGIAAKIGVAVMVEDAFWNPNYSSLDLPAWYRELRVNHGRATYLSPARGLASEIRAISARRWVSPAEEARLLGYPLCCVENRHRCLLLGEDTFFRAAMRAANGDEAEARRMILADVEFEFEGELAARIEEAMELRPCRFTSVYMCPRCAARDRSPARNLSKQYAKLAKDLDPALFEELDQAWALTDRAASERDA